MAEVMSRDIIARQAAAAAERSVRTGEAAQNPYCAQFQPDHHAEFARRFYVAMQRMVAPVDAEASA